MAREVKPEYYHRLLKPVFRGQRFLILGGGLAGLVDLGRALQALGAEPPFLLGTAGPAPDGLELPHAVLEPPARSALEAMWAYERALGDPPEEIHRALDNWDPDRRARAVGYIILGQVDSVAGRARYAARPRAWLELEDKTRFHGLLDSIGVRRGPVAVVRCVEHCLRAANDRIDRGAGTVWAGDTSPGVHGGATYVRRVFSEQSFEQARLLFAGTCQRVRITPFAEGVPCSVHGLVLPDGVAVFRPVELITLREPETGRFVYAGTATFWDPPPAARDELRSLARAIGEGLRDRAGFRGPFTVDAILGRDGVVATEINPRMGAGFQHLTAACSDLPLGPLALAAQHGEDLDYRCDALEALVLERADAQRSGSGRLWQPSPPGGTSRLDLVRDGGGYRRAGAEDAADLELHVGASGSGRFLFLVPSDRAPRREPFALDVLRAFRRIDEELGTGIGPLEAPDC